MLVVTLQNREAPAALISPTPESLTNSGQISPFPVSDNVC